MLPNHELFNCTHTNDIGLYSAQPAANQMIDLLVDRRSSLCEINQQKLAISLNPIEKWIRP